MDLALKKIELINWLTKQDESMIDKIENLRKDSVEISYQNRMDEDLDVKLNRAQSDILAGRVYSQDDVESFFLKFQNKAKSMTTRKKVKI